MGVKKEVLRPRQTSPNEHSTQYSIEYKIEAALIAHVYEQGTLGLASSILCASVVVIGLYDIPERHILIGWYAISLLIVVARYLSIKMYSKYHLIKWNLSTWRHLFAIGSFANGLCWGFLAGILLPYDNLAQFSLTLFIIAGMTSGAVPLLAGIKSAIFSFLAAALIPLIIKFLLLKQGNYHLFAGALCIYFGYLNLLALKTYHMIKNSIALQYENDTLLQGLSSAKQELEQTNIKLEHAAKHDPLTNLANRTLFEINFENAIARAHQESKILALLYLDIDNFKEVNDAYGHHVGDHLLQKVVERIKRKLPENVIASRLGGDELTIILEDMDDPEEIAELCRIICETIARPFEINDFNLSVTASIGVSIYPIDGSDTEMLIKNSDKAMYYSKERGGNNFHFNTEFSTLKSVVSNAFSNKMPINLRNS